ncbi:hypothetical protein BG015_007138, partial [Linnemannia schmuckeri]
RRPQQSQQPQGWETLDPGLSETNNQAQIAQMKARHEETLERLRLEQEAEIQIALTKAYYEERLQQL